ncbi:MAG: OmpA family protein [Candidatus Rokubacteria bacterium]|nr:OmpA family protein [Candidatus Rokubacteria bacterium]
MTHMRIAMVAAAVAVFASGCATKDWVKHVVGKERVETEQRVGQVEQRVGQVDARVGSEGQRLEGRIGEESKRIDAVGMKVKSVEEATEATRGVATAARERADVAVVRADEVDGKLTRLWTSRHKRSVVDTVRVQFGFDRFELDDRAQTTLVTLVEELKKNPALGVLLEGYTDPRGPRSYNLELSQRRVDAVRRYLVTNGVEMWRIDALGFGPLDGKETPDAQKRRVTVTLTLSE